MKQERPLLLTGVIAAFLFLSYLAGARLLPQSCLLLLLLLLVTNKRYLWIHIQATTLRRDVLAGIRYYKAVWMVYRWNKKNMTVAKIFQSVCQRHPHKVMFYYQEEKWTFQEVEDYTNKIGTFFKQQGYKKDDTIALLMENRVEYFCFWLGLSKIGVVTALINTNLKDKSLLHSISAVESEAIVYSTEYKQDIMEVKDKLNQVTLFEFGDGNLDKLVKQTVASDLTQDMLACRLNDQLLYVYTSGTTGLPKASIINNLRYVFMCTCSGAVVGITSHDCIYEPLPMYHTTGGILGLGQAILHGSTVAIRKKFSANSYWTDCIKYNCTVGMYVGEMCRCMLSTPHKDTVTKHNVRMMFGNGLRQQIWKQFVDRFRVKHIGEVYGATEGNCNLANLDGKIGAVGFVPRIAALLYPVSLIKVDTLTEEPIRNQKGLCVRSQPGEPGLFIGKINPKLPAQAFAGYADKTASEKKVLRNVFKKGDQYFNTGDVLVMDDYGYFYFMDRTGDTFRWKSENVSTCEVEAVISNIVGLKDCTVYGVEVPNTEGKAGMVAIGDPTNSLDLQKLAAGLEKSLAAYARPVFLRILDELPMTGTFKLKKRELQNEGYNPNIIKDSLYFFDKNEQQFVTLDSDAYVKITSGLTKL